MSGERVADESARVSVALGHEERALAGRARPLRRVLAAVGVGGGHDGVLGGGAERPARSGATPGRRTRTGDRPDRHPGGLRLQRVFEEVVARGVPLSMGAAAPRASGAWRHPGPTDPTGPPYAIRSHEVRGPIA
jgi:hypothetical protein